MVLAATVSQDVTTIEGLADETAHLHLAFTELGAVQCGFCTAGQVVRCSALLRQPEKLDEGEVRHQLAGNIGRCTGYVGIVDAVLAVARARRRTDRRPRLRRELRRRPRPSPRLGDRTSGATQRQPPVRRPGRREVATSQIRAMATIAGNLLQANRCWFFRNGFECYKRGGPTCPCYAVTSKHRFYHSVIDGHRCQAVTPSDLATVLEAPRRRGRVDGAGGRTGRQRPHSSDKASSRSCACGRGPRHRVGLCVGER